jgi:hypothetical protein
LIPIKDTSTYFSSKTFQEYVRTCDVDFSDWELAYFASQVRNKRVSKRLLREVFELSTDDELCNQIRTYLRYRNPEDRIDTRSRKWFFDQFYVIPYPFKKGEIVRDIVNGSIGVIETGPEHWDSYCEQHMKPGVLADASDCVVIVTSLWDRGNGITFDHHPILDLEVTELPAFGECDAYGKAIHAISEIHTGDGTLLSAMRYVSEWLSEQKK